jgi:hypothetical protein
MWHAEQGNLFKANDDFEKVCLICHRHRRLLRQRRLCSR